MKPFLLGMCLATALPTFAATNAILFVTQVPIPTEINARQVTQSFCNVSSAFGNHLGDPLYCGRGGALWIRYSNGTFANLTSLAGYTNVAVREPSVHWSGTKAVFSMTTNNVWQIYEVTNWISPVITPVSNQPTNYNNVSPTYDSNGRIIFASDRPRDGSPHLYPQREEYLQLPTVAGLWSLDPSTGDLFLLEHSPSGSFKPFVDSAGRVLFTRWDHLARDVEAATDRAGISTNHCFNWSNESVNSTGTTSTFEVFPEPHADDQAALVGTNMRGNPFNIFFPWQVNQDGTAQEVVNHIGRHELLSQVQSATFTNNPDIVTLTASQRFNTNFVANFFLSGEDPNVPGLLYGVDAIEIGTHTAGQIVTLTAATNINPDVMVLNYITPKTTAFPNNAGCYRNPRMLSNGVLIASFCAATNTDSNVGTPTSPKSKYNFRLMTIVGGTTNAYLTPGFSTNLTYLTGNTTITYSGPLWELDPAEIVARSIPTPTTAAVDPIEAGVFVEEGVDLPTFQSYLRTNNLALIVSRNVTMRDHADRQQPFNLRIPWSGTNTVATTGTVYNIGYLQLFQADLLRSVKPDGTNPLPGRRVLAQNWHDSVDENPPPLGNLPGTAQLGLDGSFAVAVPARRAMSWQTIDTNGTPIVRERYWVTFQPGEVRTCANCHGINTGNQLGLPRPTNKPEALRTFLRWWKVTTLPVTVGRIVFNTQRDVAGGVTNLEIYAMNPDGSALVNLSHNPGIDAIPRVSYDGNTIVFMSDRNNTPGNMNVWKMNSDGSNPVNLTQTNLPGATLWSAAPNFDGSKIVYMGPGSNSYDLYTMNSDGTGVTNIAHDGSFPYWSYDGSKIVFGSFRDNNNGEEIYIMNANGSGQTRLTFHSGRDFYPVISPDGSKIAYTSEIANGSFTNRQIVLMNINGTGQTNISNNSFNDQTSYFSPDGKQISFTSDRSGDTEVWVMNADGSNPHRITFSPGLEAYPAWGNIAPTPYNLWQQSNLGAIMDDTADSDGDGRANLMEYALGTNPNVPDAGVDATHFTRNLGATDITFRVEATPNLTGTWTNLATKVGGGSWVTAPGVNIIDTGTVTVTETNFWNTRFYRLHVSHP